MERGILQQAAPGLLSLLGLKQRGNNPDAFGDTLLPVMDLTAWMHLQDSEFVTQQGTIPNGESSSLFTTDATPIEVPGTEVWYVHQATLTFTVVAGDTLGGQIGIMYTSDQFERIIIPLAVADVPDLSVAINVGQFVASTPRRWFKGGTMFGAAYSYMDSVGGTSVVDITLEITRLKI